MKSFFRRKDNFSKNTNRKRVKEKEGDQFRALPKKLTRLTLPPFPRTPNIFNIFFQCPQDKIFMLLVILFDRYQRFHRLGRGVCGGFISKDISY